MILFYFFLSFSSSVFVPFKKTILPALKELNSTSFYEYKPDKKILVALVLPDNVQYEQQALMLSVFSSIIPIYSHIANFAFLRSSSVPPIFKKVPISPPVVCILFDGKLALVCPLPQSETTLAFFVGSWIDPEPNLVKTKEELYQSLGGIPLALLVREGREISFLNEGRPNSLNLETRAIMMCSEVLPFIENCIIVRVSDIFMSELNLKNNNDIVDFALYKLSDHTIVPLPNQKDMAGTIYNATKPYYSILTDFLVTRSSDVFAAYILPDNQESSDVNDGDLFLKYDISTNQKYEKAFRFVISPNITRNFISQIVRETINGPDFIVFSYSDGYYYPNDGTLKNLLITDPRWKEEAEKYLNSIIEHKIEKKFFSQKQNDKNDGKIGSALYKLVGTNYKQFVEDPDKDVAILFIDNEESDDTKNTLSVLNSTINEIFNGKNEKEIESSTISFGYININENSSPLHYPPITTVPQFMLFPAKNKTDVKLMFTSYENINFNRFLNKSMTLKPPTQNGIIEYIPFDKMSAQMESFYFSLKFRNLPYQYQQMGNEFLSMIRSILYESSHYEKENDTASGQNSRKESDYDDL